MLRISSCSFAAIAGLCGWFIGKNQKVELIKNVNINKIPGLPIFGTVSAAVPVTSNDRIVQYSESRTSQIMKYGFPSLDQVRSLDDFILSYDRRTRVANWVFEHLSKDRIYPPDQKVNRSLCDFKEDTSIHPYFRSTNKDYKGSGFDRGHLAAAGNHRMCQKDVDQTFLLTNIAPQIGCGFNRDSWNRLEKHVRHLVKYYKNVYVCTGPLYLPKRESDGKLYVKYQVIGVNHVAVPTHFFKVVVMEEENNNLHMEAYVMPNQKISETDPITLYQVPPETIERSAGLLFFDKLSREKLVQINGKRPI